MSNLYVINTAKGLFKLNVCQVRSGSSSAFHSGHVSRWAARAAAAPSAKGEDFRQKEPKDIRVLVVGATGYIGKFVVKELIKRGYNVVAFAREKSGIGGKASMDDTRKVN